MSSRALEPEKFNLDWRTCVLNSALVGTMLCCMLAGSAGRPALLALAAGSRVEDFVARCALDAGGGAIFKFWRTILEGSF